MAPSCGERKSRGGPNQQGERQISTRRVAVYALGTYMYILCLYDVGCPTPTRWGGAGCKLAALYFRICYSRAAPCPGLVQVLDAWSHCRPGNAFCWFCALSMPAVCRPCLLCAGPHRDSARWRACRLKYCACRHDTRYMNVCTSCANMRTTATVGPFL
jgi:hypothetical protein